jgi:dienelactone hydrolase
MVDSNAFLAKPSGDCCLKSSIHEGTPRGKIVTLADVETYVVTPPENKANGHILLYFPDVWGLFNNGLLIMDGFADAGYLVLGLDYFRGVNYPAKLKAPELTPSGPSMETQKG